MLTKTVETYRSVKAAHRSIVQLTTELHDDYQKLNLAEMCDLLYAIREIIRLLEDGRKVLNKFRSPVDKFACVKWMQLADTRGKQSRFHTEYCSAFPDMKSFVKHPHKRKADSEAFDKLMEHLGISKELAEMEVVRPNWEGMKHYVDQRINEGKQVPPGCDPSVTYTEFEMGFRSKKDVDE